MEEQIKAIMQSLDCTRDEAIELINEDKEIDRMTVKQAENDLTEEQKKASKKAKQTDRKKPTVYEFKPRERKPKENLRNVIQYLFKCLNDNNSLADVRITNVEHKIDFSMCGNEYTINLVEHRKPK